MSYIEVESIPVLLEHLRQVPVPDGLVVQGLDLTADFVEAALRDVSLAGTYFLGCRLSPTLDTHIRHTGGTVFPGFGDLPFNPYRAALYTPDELMAGYEHGNKASLAYTTDGRIYAHFARHRAWPVPIMTSLAYRIHDHAIDDALFDVLVPASGLPKRVVGMMGGHRMRRDEAAFSMVARSAWRLTRQGYFIASGGGPGAMEAANLGAYLATYPADALDDAIRRLAEQPLYTDPQYLEAAYAVRATYPDGQESLAVPTWFYGHEPTNLFAAHVAKYFANSLREDGLLAIARHGVIFAPGSAGTIQEIFQDAAQNHYATYSAVSPMVFLDTQYWMDERPVYPLLQVLSAGRPYAGMLALCDDVEEVVRFIMEHEPRLVNEKTGV